MKKIFLLFLVVVGAIAGNAQTKKNDSKPLSKPVINSSIKQKILVPATTIPVTTTVPPASTQKETIPITPTNNTPTRTDADYYLAAISVRISTGNDNKEANNSRAFVYAFTGDKKVSYIMPGTQIAGYANEIKANSINDFGLERVINLTDSKNSLQYYKQNGLLVSVRYNQYNFKTDAWKINNVSVTLQFKDKDGNACPSFTSKTINFPTANGILGFRFGDDPFTNDAHLLILDLKMDQYFNPLAANFRMVNNGEKGPYIHPTFY